MQDKCLAVLVAAGDGNRLGRPEGKALVALAGRPLFFYSLERLLELTSVGAVALVVRAQDHEAIADLLDQLRPDALSDGRVLVVRGGPTRRDSVRNGLEALAQLPGASGQDVVLIHDAARPLLSAELVRSAAGAARTAGGRAVVAPALSVVDAVRWVGLPEDAGSARAGGRPRPVVAPPRQSLRLMQTPQAGHLGSLLAAHRWAAALEPEAAAGYVDDVSVCEGYGMSVELVPGDQRNLKVTLPQDLAMAESLLKASMIPRSGIGFDVHPLRERPGGLVRLGGVPIPADLELVGHSDADVAAHAATDALLGAAAAGDIGIWFPPGNPEWRGADSMHLLRIVWTRLAGQGFVFGNLDLTIQAERPRLSPHYDAMRANFARALSCRPDDISVKATTMERLGAIGRGEGISAIATATMFADAGSVPRRLCPPGEVGPK